MRRILLLGLTVVLVVAALLVGSASPALAQGPPTPTDRPPGAQFALPHVLEHNPVISFDLAAGCVFLNAPPGSSSGPGHHSAFPDVPCEQ